MSPGLAGVIAASLGALVAGLLGREAIRRPPEALVRRNHRDIELGAVLGLPLVAGALLGPVLLLGTEVHERADVALALAVLLLLLGGAGLWDDLRGDERQRGFKGHLGAAKGMRLTGGLVKLVVGGIAGLLVSVLVLDGVLSILLSGAIVALSANLINLFDRAPGRAGKVALLLLLPLLALSSAAWTVGAAAIVGALVGVLPLDLRERGMLGDAGANPLGAVAGLGLSLALSDPGRAVAVAVLLAINIASERWSFSRLINNVPVLARLDAIGRHKNPA